MLIHQFLVDGLIGTQIMPKFMSSLVVLYITLANIWSLTEAQIVTRLLQTRSPSRIAVDISTELYDEYILNEDYNHINMMLLLDSSTSIGEDNFENGRLFLSWLIAMMPKGDFRNGRISTAMYSFSASAELTQEFSFGSIKYRELLRRKILNTSYHNGTSTDLSTSLFWVDTGFNASREPLAKRILIIATDGKSTDSSVYSRSLSEMVSELHATGVEIFVIALGRDLELQNLNTLTSADTKRLYPLRNLQRTTQIGTRLLALINNS